MQSVQAIPFVVPRMADAAGEAAPSTEGAFLMSFADAPPGPQDRPDAKADPGVPGFVSALPFALLPGQVTVEPTDAPAAGLQPDAVGASTSPRLSDADLNHGAAMELAGLAGAGPVPETAVTASVAGDPPVRTDKVAALQGAAVSVPVAAQTELTTARRDDPTRASASGLVGKAEDVALVPGTKEAGNDGALARSPALGGIATPDAVAVRGRDALPDSGVALGGAGVKPVPLPSALAPDIEVASGPPMPPAEAASVIATPTAESPGRTGPGRQATAAKEAAEGRGQGSRALEGAAPVSKTDGMGAPMGPDTVGPPVLAAPDRAEGKAAAPLGATTAEASVKVATTRSAVPGPGMAMPPRLTPGTLDTSPEAEPMASQDTVAEILFDRAPAETPQQPSAVGAKPAANPAGFWERLFTSLSVPLQDNRALADPVTAPQSGAGQDLEPDDGLRTDGQTAAVAVPTLPSAPIAPGLALFARGQALRADPATRHVAEGDLGELAATTAVPGSMLQALSVPQSFPAGASPIPGPALSAPSLPVPQVAAQITSALSQSADGATELALSPEELGHVRLRLERDAKHPERMVVHITFERPETLDLFRRHAGELADALRDAGYAGADIGFGQQSDGAENPDRNPASAGPNRGFGSSGQSEAQTAVSPPPRLMAGVSLDLRL